jgi:hypothetical protein
MRKLLALAPLLAAACTTMANETPPVSDGQCRSEGLDAFVGREPTPEVGSDIIAKSGAKVFRWLIPGQIVTMEFSAQRVNVYIGSNNRIERVTCG